MKLKTWLDAERGRYVALAAHLGYSKSMVSQMAKGNVPVPPRKYRDIVKFSHGEVGFEDLVPAAPHVPARHQPAAV